jgi:hypothetical protein
MIGLEDRQALAQDIEVAHAAGARPAGSLVSICVPCSAGSCGKVRKVPCRAMAGRSRCGRWPSHALSPEERRAILNVANEPRFAAVPPARIVPMLADEGTYLASESSFARVLRALGQNARRGRAKAPKASRPPTTDIATAARQV